MTTEQLRSLCNANPFVPFKIQMASDISYQVPHRDDLAVHPAGRIATVYLPDGTASTIDTILVTELLETPSTSAPQATGSLPNNVSN